MRGHRAALYARFSTDLQSDRSVDDQLALCREHATRNGFGIVAEYFDKARSGASILGRDGLLRLMEDARAGRFDVVIVEALDRLSRDQEDLAGIYKRLQFQNVQILAVHDGQADAIQVGIRGLVSTLFLADLKNKIRRGMQGVIREGRHAGGRAYGYRPTPGSPGVLAIYEPEAAIVRRIFAEAADGRTSREIAADLNADGIPPPRGTVWNASTISGHAKRGTGFLHNPLYKGEIVWNRSRMIRDPDTGRRVSRANPAEEIRRTAAPHLALVSVEQFERASAAFADRAKRKAGGEFERVPKRFLSGLLRCGCCGAGLSKVGGKGAPYVTCTRAKESGTCSNRRKYRLDRIEAAVLSGLGEQLAHPEVLAEYVRAYQEEWRRKTNEASRLRAQKERKIADLKGQMSRLMDALTHGVLPLETVEERFLPLDQERQNIERELALEPAPATIELHPKAVDQYRRSVENLAARMTDLQGTADREAVAAFRELVHHVTVRDTENRGVSVEVVGRLHALFGPHAERVGGQMVAEDGFEPPTHGL